MDGNREYKRIGTQYQRNVTERVNFFIIHRAFRKKLSHVMFAEMKSNEIESIDGTCKLKKTERFC